MIRGVAVYLGLVFLATGTEWLRFARVPEQMIHAVGPMRTGKVSDIGSTGFGKWKTFYLSLEGDSVDYPLPGFIANDLLEQGSAPTFDLKEHVNDGDQVTLQLSAGALNPFILSLRVDSPEGSPKQLVDHRTSTDRFSYARKNAQAIGYNFLAGAIFVPLLIMLLYRSSTRGRVRKWITHLSH